MVAMALGLTVVLAIATLSLDSTRSYRSTDRAGQLIENGRFAMDTLTAALEHAGYYGNLSTDNLASVDESNLPTHPCDIVPNDLSTWAIEEDLLFPIVIYRNMPTVCKNNNVPDNEDIVDNTDLLVIRRADTSQFIWNSSLGDWCLLQPGKLPNSADPCGTSPLKPDDGDIYIQTNPDSFTYGVRNKDAEGKFIPKLDLKKLDGTLADIRRYHIDIYFLNPKSSETDKNLIPSLRKFNLLSGTSPQPIIDGIESMQIQFGIDENGDGSPDTFQSSNTPSSNVVAIRINLLARSLDADPEYEDNKTYILNPDTDPVTPCSENDQACKKYHRRVFSQTVRIANVSGGRE